MYLVATDVISEARKRNKANRGVLAFFAALADNDTAIYVSAETIGELRRGVELIRHRNDLSQARELEAWLDAVCREFANCILNFDVETAQVWGKLRAPNPENPLDKQIAATALINDLTLVTRNIKHFLSSGVRGLNPLD